MDTHQMQGQWNQIKGELRSWWGKLTDDDIAQIAGDKDKLVGIVQQKYGYLHEEARREIDRRLNQFSEDHRVQAAMQSARDAIDRVAGTVSGLTAGAEEVFDTVTSNAAVKNARAEAVQFIRRHPLQALLLGFAVGYLLSRRLGR